ncbi:MAG: hypothetical protein DDT40_01399 [candidate division WS2 bacterium]|nr:hypothetical protein [Candidatus Psychracetigena formicireducens]
MTKTIEVVYENGVFKPLEKVALKDNVKGNVIIGESVTKRTFGVLKNSNMKAIIEEIEDEGVL